MLLQQLARPLMDLGIGMALQLLQVGHGILTLAQQLGSAFALRKALAAQAAQQFWQVVGRRISGWRRGAAGHSQDSPHQGGSDAEDEAGSPFHGNLQMTNEK